MITSPLQNIAKLLKISFVPLACCLYSVISRKQSIWIYLYALFAWGGDTFLLSNDFNIYKYGGVSFFLSHCMMIVFFRIHWSKVPKKCYLMMIPGILLICADLIPKMIQPTLQSFCFVSYGLILVIGSCNAIARLDHLSFRDLSYIFCVVGYWFFLVSDYILLKKEMFGSDKNLDVEIMSTYFIAQLLIFIGVSKEERKENDPSKSMKKEM